MEYFVRYARFGPSGVITKSGWRLRLFATANEARIFSRQLLVGGWKVEAGRCAGDAAQQASSPSEIATGRAARIAPAGEGAFPAPPLGRA
jgi:hypothetical protein